MWIVHYGNHLEVLADQLAELFQQPYGAPFLPEIVIVQSNGMTRWLSLELAQRLGICAQIHFSFAASFVWDLGCRLLSNMPATSPFAPDVLTWRIMALLEGLEESPQFAPLHAYCEDGDDFTRFALASRIADVFDQYLVYRPDWIRQWERGEDEHWQAELWRRLVTSNALHRVRLHEQLLIALQAERVVPVGVPARVSLIGIPTMPPLYLEVFARLAACIDVHCFILNPSRLAGRGMSAERERAQRVPMSDAEARSGITGNRLLASMGKLGQDFIDLMSVHQPQVTEQFVEPGNDTLLHCLQSDILNGQNRGTAGCPATPVQADDCSVQAHVCHSRLREVEVLYDQLVRLFEMSPALQPAGVLVMTPDIDAYAPLI